MLLDLQCWHTWKEDPSKVQIILARINSVSYLQWSQKEKWVWRKGLELWLGLAFLQVFFCVESTANSTPWVFSFCRGSHSTVFCPSKVPCISLCCLHEHVSSLLQTFVGNSLLNFFLRNCTRDPDASCISSQASVTSLCWGCPILCCFPSEKPGLACREKDFFKTTFSVEYLILVRVLSPS